MPQQGPSAHLVETPQGSKHPLALQSRCPTTPSLIFLRQRAPTQVRIARTAWRAVVNNGATGAHPRLQARAVPSPGPVPAAATGRDRTAIEASAAWVAGEADPAAEDAGADAGCL